MNFEFLDLPQRTAKPRQTGITSVYDILSLGQLKILLEDFHPYIDLAKLGMGTSYITPRLKDKLALYREFGIKVQTGGTLFEKFFSQNKLDELKRFLERTGIEYVEISNGSVDITLEERVALIQDFKKDFKVITEIGSKDVDHVMAPSIWVREMKTLIEEGCEYVITEGRASGTAGIYRKSGEIREGLIDEIKREIPIEKVIFEAPKPSMQMFFINLIGSNVNLGNVLVKDVLLLESQRLGLRSETFDVQ
ncbi:MAG: phosphosulfolactate synthase [Bacteroidota bacterium]